MSRSTLKFYIRIGGYVINQEASSNLNSRSKVTLIESLKFFKKAISRQDYYSE